MDRASCVNLVGRCVNVMSKPSLDATPVTQSWSLAVLERIDGGNLVLRYMKTNWDKNKVEVRRDQLPIVQVASMVAHAE